MKLIFALMLMMGHVYAGSSHDAKILSWNVFMLPKPIWFSWQNYRTNLIAEKLKKTDYDVMFFQEAFLPSFRSRLNKDLKKMYPYQYHLSRKGLKILGSGVYVMSRHPMKVLDKVYYGDCKKEDCLAAKGAVLVEIRFPSGKVAQFANTHLQAKERYGQIRLAQLEQIRKMMEKHKKPGVPQLLVGDLNIDLPEPEFASGLTNMNMDYLDLSGPIKYTNKLVNECYKTYGNGIDHEWIDHVWFKGMNVQNSTLKVKEMSFNYQGKFDCPLSDHHALEAQLSF